MKTRLLTLALAGLFTAQGVYANDSSTIEPKPFVTMAYAFGGDTVGGMTYEDNTTTDITSGGGLTIGGGINIAVPEQPYGVTVSGGYQFDSAVATNAEVSFDRLTLNFVPYYQATPQVKVAAGFTFHGGVEFISEMDGRSSESLEFDSAFGFVGEITVETSPLIGVGVRVTSIDYTLAQGRQLMLNGQPADSLSGSNIGLFINWGFGNTAN